MALKTVEGVVLLIITVILLGISSVLNEKHRKWAHILDVFTIICFIGCSYLLFGGKS